VNDKEQDEILYMNI